MSGRRRWRTKQEKRLIVGETLRPGASVSIVARRHDVNANQLFRASITEANLYGTASLNTTTPQPWLETPTLRIEKVAAVVKITVGVVMRSSGQSSMRVKESDLDASQSHGYRRMESKVRVAARWGHHA
jgi:transposase-like protein